MLAGGEGSEGDGGSDSGLADPRSGSGSVVGVEASSRRLLVRVSSRRDLRSWISWFSLLLRPLFTSACPLYTFRRAFSGVRWGGCSGGADMIVFFSGSRYSFSYTLNRELFRRAISRAKIMGRDRRDPRSNQQK